MSIEILIENRGLHEDILDYASWKLYKYNKFPKKGRLDDIIIKKEVNGELVFKFLSQFVDDDEEKFTKNIGTYTRVIEEEEVGFQIGEGIFKIPMGEEEIELEYFCSKEVYTTSHELTTYKKIYLRGQEELVKKFISEMDKYIKKFDKNYIKVLSPNNKGFWDVLFKTPKRSIETVFINQKKEIIEDLEEFITSENDYKIFGHPYKRNYLFYGPPGNGKTSFINAIASNYNLDIYMVSFSSMVTDELFKKIISTIPKNALLVIEDIDVLFDEKERKNLSMSTVLNIMDGLARKTRIICVMTTNNFDKLSEVFKRPGRIDKIVEFAKADQECFQEMAEFMFKYHKEDSENLDKIDNIRKHAINFYDLISYMEPSRALVQKFLFENRRNKSEEIFSKKMINKFKCLNDLYQNQNKENPVNLYN